MVKNEEMILRLDIKNLHEDLERLREKRKNLEKDGIWIRVKWKEDTKEHELPVYAKGSNLWVEAFENSKGEIIEFSKNERDLNYKKEDKGCRLTILDVVKKLKVLENAGNHFKVNDNRDSYVICVFVVSEMVRNELLEQLLIKQSIKEVEKYYSWNDCVCLYKNWKNTSEALYVVRDFYPVIYAKDLKHLWVRVLSLDNDVKELYENLLEKLGIL